MRGQVAPLAVALVVATVVSATMAPLGAVGASSADASSTVQDESGGNETLLRHADGATVTRTVTVTANARVEAIEYEVAVSEAGYEAMREAADGDVARALAGDLLTDSAAEAADTEVVEDDGGYRLRVRTTDVRSPERYGINATRTEPPGDVPSFGDVVRYEDSLAGAQALPGAAEVEYAVEVPGQVVDTNAQELDEGTARWTFEGDERPRRLFVESGIGSQDIPGFGVGAAMVGALVAALALARQAK